VPGVRRGADRRLSDHARPPTLRPVPVLRRLPPDRPPRARRLRSHISATQTGPRRGRAGRPRPEPGPSHHSRQSADTQRAGSRVPVLCAVQARCLELSNVKRKTDNSVEVLNSNIRTTVESREQQKVNRTKIFLTLTADGRTRGNSPKLYYTVCADLARTGARHRPKTKPGVLFSVFNTTHSLPTRY
jgi:hypothetical protein